MSRIEPILSDEDLEVWDIWQRTCLAHAGTRLHKRRVEAAKQAAQEALDHTSPWYAAVSAGKDSAVMLHLIASVAKSGEAAAASVVDDVEYPGEREQLSALSDCVGIPIEIASPEMSTWQAIVDSKCAIYEPLHDVASGVSKSAFMPVISRIESKYNGVFLGLRAEESKYRNVSRAVRGRLYQRNRVSGVGKLWTSTPIADWRGLDVYAYAFTHSVPLHPLYRCCAFVHRKDPSRLRLDWWLPGQHGAKGHVQWLRRYYPSLYTKLRGLFADAWQYTA